MQQVDLPTVDRLVKTEAGVLRRGDFEGLRRRRALKLSFRSFSEPEEHYDVSSHSHFFMLVTSIPND